jgi:hypothetical protein
MKKIDGINMQVPIQIPSPSEFVIENNTEINSQNIYNKSI